MEHAPCRLGLVLLALLGVTACDADVSAGRAIFEDNCIRCHRAGPASLDTPVRSIPEVLREGTIRAHRFQLDDRQLQALLDYLEAGSDKSE